MTAALAILLHPGPAMSQTMEQRAQSAAEAARAKSGDSEAIRQNYLTPGLAGQPISTVDGSATFAPNIACSRTATLLEVMVQPSGSGDLSTVRISRDTDLDGHVDTVSNLPVPISGICANGVVSCTTGSWNSCQFFRWNVGTDRSLALVAAPQQNLAGCYCINNSCGAGLAWTNMPSVLRDLGGGMIGALTTADPRYGIVEAVIDGPVIRYVGAQSTDCTANPPLPQSSYRANPAPLAADAFAVSTGNPVFQALQGSAVGSGTSLQYRHCTVERQVKVLKPHVDEIITRVSGGYLTERDGAAINFNMGSPGYNSLYGGSCGLIDFHMTLRVGAADRILEARLNQFFADDWGQLRIDGKLIASGPYGWTSSGFPPGKCELNGTFYHPPVDLKPYLTPGDHQIWLRAAVGDKGQAFAQIKAILDETCQVQEQVADQCSAIAADSECKIDTEFVDGVQSFRNGVATGLKPLVQTRLLGAPACPTGLKRDFFLKDRVYRCAVRQSPQPDTSRGAYILDHSTETLLADRARQGDGSLAATTRPFSLPDRGAVPTCEAICKTRAPKANSDVALAGVVGEKQNQPQGFDTFYHACRAGNQCPLGPGEEIVSPCGCLDDFPEAAVMMQTVRLAGADLICTGTAR